MVDDIDPYYELDGKRYSLNEYLIHEKCLTQKQVNKIKDLHIERLMTEATLNQQYDNASIRAWYNVWEQIQFELQDAWGFPRNAHWHPSHRLSLCSCPKIDNADMLGTPYSVRVNTCKLHNALSEK